LLLLIIKLLYGLDSPLAKLFKKDSSTSPPFFLAKARTGASVGMTLGIEYYIHFLETALVIQTGAIVLIKSCPRYSRIILYAQGPENNRKKSERAKF